MNRISFVGIRHTQRRRWWPTLAALGVVLCVASATPAAEPGDRGVDAVLLMDSSGSMAKNDPHKLRVPAAKLFMSLLGEDDRIGLISFSDNGYPVLRLTAPGPENNPRILASADKVSSKGVYTNLYAALQKGAQMLERQGRAGQEKMLVLMSDGKMDVGNSDDDWQLRQRLQGELLKSLQDKHIKIYTIAFTDASDTELLQSLAQQSGALFKLAKNDTDLHEVFSDIFETAKSPDMLPIDGGEFSVDPSIEEVTIVASKDREDVRIYLQSPQGKKYSSEDASDTLKWFLSDHFDMITLRRPETGTWKLLFTGGKNRAYIVTNMSLHHNPQQSGIEIGAHTVLESWLEQDGKLLDKEALLTNTRFRMKVQTPDGASAEFELYDDGQHGDRKMADAVYSNTLAFDKAGAYSIDLIAESQTFTRQKTVHFEVAATPASGAQEASDETPPAAASASPPPPAAPDEVVAAVPEAGEDVPPEADSETQAKAQAKAAQPEAPTEKKKSFKLGAAIGVFVGINLLLVALGFALWWFLKKRKQKAAAASDETDESEEQDA